MLRMLGHLATSSMESPLLLTALQHDAVFDGKVY